MSIEENENSGLGVPGCLVIFICAGIGIGVMFLAVKAVIAFISWIIG